LKTDDNQREKKMNHSDDFENVKQASGLPVILLMLATATFLSGCLFGPKEINPSIKIVAPAQGSTIHQSSKFSVKVQTSNFTFANGQAKSSAAQAAAVNAQIQLFLDRSTDLITDSLAVMKTSDTITIDTMLSVGAHYLIAAGVTPGNPDSEGMTDTSYFTVTAP